MFLPFTNTQRQQELSLTLQQTGPRHIDLATILPPAPTAPAITISEVCHDDDIEVLPIPINPRATEDKGRDPEAARDVANMRAAPPATTGKFTENISDWFDQF